MPLSVHSAITKEKNEYSWRGITREDLPDVWELSQTVNRVDNKDNTETLDDLQREFDDPWSDPLRDGRVIRTLKGKLAAFARIFVNPEPVKENAGVMWCEVAPEERGDGLEQECLEWMEERATERLAEAAEAEGASALPRTVRVLLQATDTRTIDLYTAHGFSNVRTFYSLERDLNEPIPANPLPDGLELRIYDEALDDSMLDAYNESFGDSWGHQYVTSVEWQPFMMSVSDVRRDLTLVVMDGSEVIAFSINRVKREENERLGMRRGWIGNLGTRRKYRKRGIASALIAESMRRYKEEGFDTLGLSVDTASPTGALDLYRGLGFKAYKTRVILQKSI